MTLDLLPYAQRCKTRETAGRPEIWCPVRSSWLAAQPEEFVRQGLIELLRDIGYSTNLMQVERKVGSTRDRLDLLLLDVSGRPLVLAEAKAPGYKLQPAVAQLARYNRFWKAPYTLAVNGAEAICCHVDFLAKQVHTLDELPRAFVDKSPT